MRPENFPKPTILVVDDEALIRWSLSQGLARQGFRVLEAADGRDALRHFAPESNSIEIVFLDLRLPDSGDLGLLKSIRQVAPACQVILMTAYGTPAVVREALTLGAFRVVEKPFDVHHMVDLAAEALQAGA